MHIVERVRQAVIGQIRGRGVQIKRMPRAIITQPEVALTVTLGDLVRRLSSPSDVFFVQVGAYDGVANDPLHDLVTRYGWRGVMVEPQKRPFEHLVTKYSGQPGLMLRNVAVAAKNETRTFYSLDEAAPTWAHQLASLDPGVILRHGPNEELRPHIIANRVQCVTFESLLADVSRVDVLQIDAEGYDADLVRLFDFDRWRPSIVQFEHRHLSRRDHDVALRRLITRGYRVMCERIDTLAFRAHDSAS